MADATPELARPGLRGRFNAFIVRHEVAWELTMGALALVWVAIGFADLELAGLDTSVALLETGLTAVFIVEFGARFLAAHDRLAYLRSHWIDAIALVPAVRGARILRLLRLLRLVRAFAGLYRAVSLVEGLGRNRGFAGLVIVWLTVMVLCSAFVYAAENGTSELIASPFDALWWGVTTITTVGYGDVYPKTPEGRLGAMILMILGIALFSAVTATITAYIARSSEDRSDDLADRIERLAQLRREGLLTEEEYGVAKARLIGGGG